MSMSQPNRPSNSSTLSGNNLEAVSMEVVRYIIAKSNAKNPIKRADLLKFLNTFAGGLNRKTNEILANVKDKLEDIYGFQLVELDSKSQYILVLCEDSKNFNMETNLSEFHILLMGTLAHIFMNGGSVKEDAMWKFLEKAGLMKNGDANIKKVLMQHFTKQLYLNYVKTGELENQKFIFTWGARASAEISKQFLLKKIGEAFNRPPEYWYEQHKETLAE